MEKYKHIFFDLDHTIWDFEANAKLTMHALYEDFELASIGITNFDNFFNAYSEHNHKLWARYTKGFIRQEELRWKRMWHTLLDYKIANEGLSKEMSTKYLDLLPTRTKLFPYTHELLTYLKSKNYMLHIITNGFEDVQHNKIKNSNLSQYFTNIITSQGSNSVKPEKAIFDYAMQKANAIAANCVMIGDNIDADIQGGINAGIDTIFVNHIQAIPSIKATFEVASLQEITTIL